MRPLGRRAVALAGLIGAMAGSLCAAAAGIADTYKTEVELTTKNVGSKESNLGNIVADAMRAAAKTDIAIIPASAFNETTIAKGSFTPADVLRALENKSDTIVIVKLTGDQIVHAMQHSLYLYPKLNNSSFLQTSGLTITVNPDADKEKKLVSVKLGDDALEAGKTYKVAMPAPLANGALAYFKFWKKENIDKDTEKTLEKAVTDYLSDHKTITKGDERLVAKGNK